MQSDWKEIYRLTSERTNKSEQTYKDLGGFVFANLAKNIKRPKSLILKLKGVGTWYLRRRRMEILVNEFPPDYGKTFGDDFFSKIEFLKHENRKEVYEIFQARLKDYEEYLKERDKTRVTRHETQKPIQSKDNTQEYPGSNTGLVQETET